jgi:hypothetical protein
MAPASIAHRDPSRGRRRFTAAATDNLLRVNQNMFDGSRAAEFISLSNQLVLSAIDMFTETVLFARFGPRPRVFVLPRCR